MPIEVHAPTSTTPNLLDAFGEMNQSEMSNDTSFWFADGKESLAASLDAASLQKQWLDVAGHLLFEPAAVIQMHTPLGRSLFPMLLDVGCLDLTASQKVVVDDRGRERFATKLWASFEDNPFEDGMDHPAEGIIAEALRSAKGQRVLEWLGTFSTDASQPSFAASVLRCLGRHGSVGTVPWRVGLVRDGLTMDSVEIRDAAVQAAESWGDTDLLDVLGLHSEPEPWLRQYIVDVIDDLAG